MLDDEWCKRVEEDLAKLRKDIYDLADRSLIERITRQEEEKNRAFARSRASTKVEAQIFDRTTAKLCEEFLDKGDLDTAFLTVLRYIETIAQEKADVGEIHTKATRAQVEKTFDKLCSVNNQMLTEKYNSLHTNLGDRLQKISKDFSDFSGQILEHLDNADSLLSILDETVARHAGMVHVERRTSQASTMKTSKKGDKVQKVDVAAMLAPRRALKPRNDGIVMPVKIPKKQEPTAKTLMQSVTTISETRKRPKSLIATV